MTPTQIYRSVSHLLDGISSIAMNGPVDQLADVRGQFARKGEALARDRVDEAEHRGMKRLALEPEFLKERPKLRTGSSIDTISN